MGKIRFSLNCLIPPKLTDRLTTQDLVFEFN